MLCNIAKQEEQGLNSLHITVQHTKTCSTHSFLAALQNFTFQINWQTFNRMVFFRSKAVFSLLSFHYFRQTVNINIKTGALKVSFELFVCYMIQNHDLVKHKKNLQQNYPYMYLTCVSKGLLLHEYKSAFNISSEMFTKSRF